MEAGQPVWTQQLRIKGFTEKGSRYRGLSVLVAVNLGHAYLPSFSSRIQENPQLPLANADAPSLCGTRLWSCHSVRF